MTPSTLIFRIRVSNVPTTLPHKLRKDEIEELPNYLQVDGSTPGQMALINYGEGTPSADAAVAPWLKVGNDNQPDGFYVKYNGIWYPAELHGVQAPAISYPMIQSGSFTVAATAASVDHADIVTFTTAYASTPKVFLTITANSVKTATMADWYIIVPSATGFSLNNLIFAAGCDLTFDWIAIGARNPAA